MLLSFRNYWTWSVTGLRSIYDTEAWAKHEKLVPKQWICHTNVRSISCKGSRLESIPRVKVKVTYPTHFSSKNIHDPVPNREQIVPLTFVQNDIHKVFYYERYGGIGFKPEVNMYVNI